jgi:hypothetical protein
MERAASHPEGSEGEKREAAMRGLKLPGQQSLPFWLANGNFFTSGVRVPTGLPFISIT